jgi:TetR/AcrR family transcriptional regulator, mexJK operon transcriptional repressor
MFGRDRPHLLSTSFWRIPARREFLSSYAERGPGRTVEALTSGFQDLAARGLLRLDDAPMAARHFLWLVVSIPLNEAMLRGDDGPFTTAELEGFADAGSRTFLAAYGSPSSPAQIRRKKT